MTTKPHDALGYCTPDQVAECWDGVTSVPGLYEALWGLTEHYSREHEENIEDMGPHDVIGINSVSSFWEKLSEEHRTELNRLAEENDRELGIPMSFGSEGDY